MTTTDDRAPEAPFPVIEHGGRPEAEVLAHLRASLASDRVAVVRGVPLDAKRYLGLLRQLGEPLDNYASRSALDADAPAPQINRVRYRRKGEYTTASVHYVAGELRPHSARSWRDPRPRWFAMLMVDPGWRDTPPGQRGESVVLRWEKLFARRAARDGAVFAEHFGRLSTTPVEFPANNVREELARTPLLYPLPDSTGPYDVGVRLKQDLVDKLPALADQLPDPGAYRRSVEYLVQAAADTQAQDTVALDAGDLIVLDNDRCGHGRRTIVGERPGSGGTEVNPRELWSVTVA